MQPAFQPREIWPPGTVIKSDYVIEKKLGSGGFGTVYIATHRFLGSKHVIKRLHEQYASDESYSRKFILEGQAIRRLKSCPYIVEIEHMTQSEDGHLILVMEYLPDGDLEKLMSHGSLTVGAAVRLAMQIAVGLKAAHAIGIIHRDIKPQNVMLAPSDGEVIPKLIDFGIAADTEGVRTTSIYRGGSPGYAAPEQWMLSGKDLDGRCDIYPLGVTLYQMLAGRMPFEVQSLEEWIDKAKAGPPPAPSTFRREIPAELDQLVLEMLAFNRDYRPHDAQTVINRLAQVLSPLDSRSVAGAGQQMRSVTILSSQKIPTEKFATTTAPPPPPSYSQPHPPQPYSQPHPQQSYSQPQFQAPPPPPQAASKGSSLAWLAIIPVLAIAGGGAWYYTRPPVDDVSKEVKDKDAGKKEPKQDPKEVDPVKKQDPPKQDPPKQDLPKEDPPPHTVDVIAQGDEALQKGDFPKALAFYRNSGGDARRAERVERLREAVEVRITRQVHTLSGDGHFDQADNLVDRWLMEFPRSRVLLEQKTLIKRRRDTQ